MELTSELTMLTYDAEFIDKYIEVLQRLSLGGYTSQKETYFYKKTGNSYEVIYTAETDETND